ncbi:MAG: hypothetical protein E6H52_11865 [Betaproteobacteria bacterium]|jgi:hypothetical protein|nr:MAG: hypothetical protein E6H52_11865 [Betaproteobacteria bacterium]
MTVRLKECDVTQRPLYGVLVIGELPHEADPRAAAARQPQAASAPAESFLRRTLSRWVRKVHSIRERSS